MKAHPGDREKLFYLINASDLYGHAAEAFDKGDVELASQYLKDAQDAEANAYK